MTSRNERFVSTRFARLRVSLVLLPLGLSLAAADGSAANSGSEMTAPSPPTLSSYIAAIHPQILSVTNAHVTVLRELNTKNFEYKKSKFLVAAAQEDRARLALMEVRAPPALRVPHAELLTGLRLDATGVRRLAAGHFDNLAESLFGSASDRAESWKQEVTAQPRRAGAAVPLWLKSFHMG